MDTLVSVIVVTYNSSRFIEETLNSIRNQSYKEIELIITDDSSKDHTIDICKRWLEQYESCFVRTELVQTQTNTGVTGNFLRGIHKAKGKWIKSIGGDDALLINCIEDNLSYISVHRDVKILFSYCRMYEDYLREDCFINLNPPKYPSNIIHDTLSADDQYKLLLVNNRISFTPSAFYHHETFKKSCKLDQSSGFTEDLQMWLGFTSNGIKLYFMEKETIMYRSHKNSLSKKKEEFILDDMYFKSIDFWNKKIRDKYPWDLKYSRVFSWYVNQIFRIEFFNKKTKLNSMIYYLVNRILNPFHYVVFIKARFFKKYKDDIFYKL